MMSMRLLVVEDELRMLELLRRGLTEEGHTVLCAVDGNDAWLKLREQEFDVVVLDVMLPKMSGFELALQMRTGRNSTPVLMLTAKDSVPDIVHGLDLGADDYMTKPFSFNELLLRLQAVKRRASACRPPKLQVADLWLDPTTRQVSRCGETISLTRTEYTLLERLMSNAGRVVPREALLSIWGRKPEIEGNTLDAFMRLLRNKIDNRGRERLIHTVRGVGYTVRSEVEL
jgi:DNA-binding response OmpR family regulator